ncbi:MAG: hypothetical protein GTN62_08130 [Gemmatimonadales bacterium]|nr:hypothetical protein [Gemmatimonadales bacterium]NIN11460.1 hypothetical protein [Gemmatimonadales bacterium]NIN50069.1 hypothetical protein [Gemmatimonadales bacterium]NIP07533.1 hypothetical protein [Gemmatimonadales bacterium]NIR03175.1 hypothetical protein [Gemmatimonadales bacterium]
MRIQINLLGGPKKRRKARAGISLPDFGEFAAKVKDPLLVGAVGAWTVALAAIGFFYFTQGGQLASLEAEANRVRSDSRRFSNMILQKRRAERLRDSLEVELRGIRQIDADRYIWPHILEEVTKALPDYTWLVGLNVVTTAAGMGAAADTALAGEVRFIIEGRTSDYNAYTRFLRQLSDSPWIGNVVPGAISTVVEQEKALRSFTVTATFAPADSAFIRTVPVAESVR